MAWRRYVAQQTIKGMINNGGTVKDAKVIVRGLTFKENCPDLRNSRVAVLVKTLKAFGCDVVVPDPIAESAEAEHEYGISLTPWDQLPSNADAIVAAVSYQEYMAMSLGKLTAKLRKGGDFTDVKSACDQAAIKAAGLISGACSPYSWGKPRPFGLTGSL
jgi:UDP-N-acetyl-D-galactosamine dehydrogenase